MRMDHLFCSVTDLLELEGTSVFDETLQAKEHLRLFHEMLFPKYVKTHK